MKYKIKVTLIVCPVSLIDQWRREIEGKTDPQLNVLAFHGKRTDSVKEIAEYDGILYILNGIIMVLFISPFLFSYHYFLWYCRYQF
jgi:SNF2 family DNA or RNA helicase